MAIKGKTRKQRAHASAPLARQRIEGRLLPLTRRTWFRRSAGAVFVALSLWGALFAYGRVTRADALRRYVRALDTAMAEYQKHAGFTGDESVLDLSQRFTKSDAVSTQMLAAADLWANDFDAAGVKVRALNPPSELRLANSMISQGIDIFGDLARLYVVAGQQRALEVAATGAVKTKLESQVQLQLTHLETLRRHGEALIKEGRAAVDALRRAWGVAT